MKARCAWLLNGIVSVCSRRVCFCVFAWFKVSHGFGGLSNGTLENVRVDVETAIDPASSEYFISGRRVLHQVILSIAEPDSPPIEVSQQEMEFFFVSFQETFWNGNVHWAF